jgi:hypothetical protein
MCKIGTSPGRLPFGVMDPASCSRAALRGRPRRVRSAHQRKSAAVRGGGLEGPPAQATFESGTAGSQVYRHHANRDCPKDRVNCEPH